MNRSLGVFPFLVLTLFLSGCPSTSHDAPADGRLQVVATTAMVGDFVKAVAGDAADVNVLINQGVDPHLYRPTSRDVTHIMQADIVFYTGLKLEGAMEAAFENAKRRGNLTVAISSSIPKSDLSFAGDFDGHPDPHIWHDPVIWSKCAESIVQGLSEKRPEERARFEANALKYQQSLEKLDAHIRQVADTIPEGGRYLVTAHDAFSYFAKRYGLTVHSVQGISTDSEPGVLDINQLVDFLVEKKIPALFVEKTVNPASLNAVIERCQQRGWRVHHGGELFSDSMGAAGSPTGNYIGMMNENVKTIVTALGGRWTEPEVETPDPSPTQPFADPVESSQAADTPVVAQ